MVKVDALAANVVPLSLPVTRAATYQVPATVLSKSFVTVILSVQVHTEVVAVEALQVASANSPASAAVGGVNPFGQGVTLTLLMPESSLTVVENVNVFVPVVPRTIEFAEALTIVGLTAVLAKAAGAAARLPRVSKLTRAGA